MLTFYDYRKVFTPSSPLEETELCVGRVQEFADIERILKKSGEFAIVIGHRGVGKTSLCRIGLTKAWIGGRRIFVSCYEGITFNELCESILSRLPIGDSLLERTIEVTKKASGSAKIFDVGVEGGAEVSTGTTIEKFFQTKCTPDRIYIKLRDLFPKNKQGLVIIIDEYDRVKGIDSMFHANVADFIKRLADNSSEHEIKVIVVGISETVESLLGTHRSIERCIKEIYVRRLRKQDMEDFLEATERLLQFRFEPVVRSAIADFSMGYPYYLHLIGELAVDSMAQRLKDKVVDEQARVVIYSDFENAVQKAVTQAFQSNFSKYREHVRNLNPKERKIITVLCKIEDDRQIKRGTLKNLVIIDSQKGDSEESLSTAEFDSSLLKLQQEKNIIHVGRTSDLVRFSEPLMAPFLRAILDNAPVTPHSRHKPLQLLLFGDT